MNLPKTHCIHQVISYGTNGSPRFTWTCSSTRCPNYGDFSLTVSTERSTSHDQNIDRKKRDRPPQSDCKDGDTVKIKKRDDGSFSVYEIAIIGKEGEILNCWIRLHYRLTLRVHCGHKYIFKLFYCI